MDDPQRLRPVLPGQLVVLVADDSALICNILRFALEAMGMFVLAATDGQKALELSQKFPGTIHAVVSDIVLPNLDGLGLCDQIRLDRPGIKLLLMSGNSGPADGTPFLQKPFRVEELKQKMRYLVDGMTPMPPAS